MASEFDNVLRQFRTSLLEYKVTGQSVYKQQADVAEKWLRDYISTLNQTIQRDATYIDKFAKEYETTNPELVKFKKEIANARKKGPELQDVYEGEKQAQEEEPVDESIYYTKAAVVGGILALGAVVSFL
jgi:cell shape-determining protein MreC